MAPSTRQTERPSTPERHIRTGEYDTIQRTRIFTAYDAAIPFNSSQRLFCKQNNIPRATLRDMWQLRDKIGPAAHRRQRPSSTILGRRPILGPVAIQAALHAPQEQRRKPVQQQISKLGLNCHPATFERALHRCSHGGRIYKARWRQKKLSTRNRQDRIAYALEHQHHTVDNYYQYVVYTDEAHFCQNESSRPLILRELGTADEPENIVERGQKEDVTLHVAGWVNWYTKCDKLEFYNDEEIITFVPDMRKRPRRSKYEDDATFRSVYVCGRRRCLTVANRSRKATA